MKSSFDEIRKIAFRALNGAGAPPGIDDDGGWACAWLEAAGYPGLRMLADFLDADTGHDRFAGIDSIDGDVIEAGGLSAVTLAGVIVEYAAASGNTVTVNQLQHAPYLIAHAARLAKSGKRLTIEPTDEAASTITLQHSGDGYEELVARVAKAIHRGMNADDDAYARVYTYSREILVEQTEASLLGGAGAGLTDND